MKKVGLQEQKGGKNIVHEEQIWRDHISVSMFYFLALIVITTVYFTEIIWPRGL